MTTRAQIDAAELLDGLTQADVMEAARLLVPVDDADRIAVIVNNRSYDPLDLIAHAAQVQPDHIRLTKALAVLAGLDFHPAPNELANATLPPPPAPSTSPTPDARDLDRDRIDAAGTSTDTGTEASKGPGTGTRHEPHGDAGTKDSDADNRAGGSRAENSEGEGSDDDAGPDITPALALQMQRHRGEWVAVKKGRLLAHAPKLRDLLTIAPEQNASVLFVPVKENHADE